MTPATELDRLFSEQLAGLTLPKPVQPLPTKDATPVPEFKNREGVDL